MRPVHWAFPIKLLIWSMGAFFPAFSRHTSGQHCCRSVHALVALEASCVSPKPSGPLPTVPPLISSQPWAILPPVSRVIRFLLTDEPLEPHRCCAGCCNRQGMKCWGKEHM